MPDGVQPLGAFYADEVGVRGHLDSQDQLNARLRDVFGPILERAEAQLDLVFANILEAGKFATASEIKVRENTRLSVAGRFEGDEFEGTAVQFNDQGTRSAERAISLVTGASDRLRESGTALAELRRVHRDAAARAAVEDGREAFFQALTKFVTLDPEDFGEVQRIWDEDLTPTLSRNGVEGLLDYTQTNLDEFVSRRGTPDRGNIPHSPLAWWKYVLIAAILAAAVFAVIACFWWFGCTWVWQALGLVAPWVFGIIDRGC